jgi:hypothetical protein
MLVSFGDTLRVYLVLSNLPIAVHPAAEPGNGCALCRCPARHRKRDHRVLPHAFADGSVEHDTQWQDAIFSDGL